MYITQRHYHPALRRTYCRLHLVHKSTSSNWFVNKITSNTTEQMASSSDISNSPIDMLFSWSALSVTWQNDTPHLCTTVYNHAYRQPWGRPTVSIAALHLARLSSRFTTFITQNSLSFSLMTEDSPACFIRVCLPNIDYFYRAMLCIRGTSHGPVSICLSVCLSVCHKSVFY